MARQSAWLVEQLFICFLILFIAGCSGMIKSTSTTVVSPQPAQKQVPTVTVSANPAIIAAGSFTTLQWSTTNASSIAFTPAIPTEETTLPLNATIAIAPAQTTTYTAMATGAGGKAQQSVTVTVNAALPSISFVASPSSIVPGGQSTLNWNVTNATSMTIDGIGAVALPSGSAVVSPSVTTTYTARATGAGGTAVQTVTVDITSISAFTVSPDSSAPGQQVTLSWSAPNAASLKIDQGVGNVSAPSGSVNVAPTTTTRYTLTATNPDGTTSSASVLAVVSQAGTGFTKIKHIIFFVQENRSFDNYFGRMGQYRRDRGFTDPIDDLPLTATQNTSAGQPISPFHFQTECHENVPNGWYASHQDYDNGAMDKFVISDALYSSPSSIDSQGTRAMGYYDWTDLPYYYELAFQFGTSDRFFSSVMAETIPNRMYLFAATSFGFTFPPAKSTVGGWTQPTIFDALDKAGISWRYYYQDNGVFLSQFSTWFRDAGKVYNISHWNTDLQNEKTLPQVIFIERTVQLPLDEHPDHNIQTGAVVTENIISTLMQSPAWPSSVFILTFDESGGMYDHVPPVPMPLPDNIPPSVDGNLGTFNQSGFRVPLIVVSPWLKPHFVSHVPRDLTSILRLIEVRFGVPALTMRDASADDMTEFFDFASPPQLTPPALPLQPTNGTCNFQLETGP